ncbi:hypothetical protein NPIL_51831 [Nephila pilipes]|uniref:Uncharacterized protein n=1 Tax=Nephila pilipes TaxID=299642 RepID=A0A8X6IKM1_NEPPI|nr:hypothetical protein NPIL_51831 [Nephila pilipes]
MEKEKVVVESKRNANVSIERSYSARCAGGLPSTPKGGTSRTLSRCSKKNFSLQVGAGFNAKCPSKGVYQPLHMGWVIEFLLDGWKKRRWL